MKEKDKIRRLFVPQRMSLEKEFVKRAGEDISSRLMKIAELMDSDIFAAFAPAGGEPDITGFLRKQISKGKEVCFPRFRRAANRYEMAVAADLAKDFARGKFGIMEPVPEKQAVPANVLKETPWLVPGIAFDRKGGRLGHGKGIFDRLLSDASGFKIGICYEWQIIDTVPSDAVDVMMDMVVTESGTYRCTRKTERRDGR